MDTLDMFLNAIDYKGKRYHKIYIRYDGAVNIAGAAVWDKRKYVKKDDIYGSCTEADCQFYMDDTEKSILHMRIKDSYEIDNGKSLVINVLNP